MTLTPKDIGILVEHPVWQRGRVLDVVPPYVFIHFSSLINSPEGPERKLRDDAPQLTKSMAESDPDLDSLAVGPDRIKKTVRKPKVKALSYHLDEAITWFVAEYPAKFEDEKFVDPDLRNKRAAHEVFTANFGEGRGQGLVDAGNATEIANVIDSLFRATNICSTFEIKAVHKGLQNGDAAKHVLETLLPFLANPNPAGFAAFNESIAQLPSGGGKVLTWPNVTLLPFLAQPKQFIALKPSNTELMAARMNFDLRYQTVPNWATFDALQRMSRFLLQRLEPLGARDMIDVQAFMWVTRELS